MTVAPKSQTDLNGPIQRIVVVGADLLGWSAAVCLARGLRGQNVNIVVLDSPAFTHQPDTMIHASSHLFDFHKLLGIQEKSLLINGHAKLCSAAKFTDFSSIKPDYYLGCDIHYPSFHTVELHHVMSWLSEHNLSPYSLSAIAAQNNKLALPTTTADPIRAGFLPSAIIDTSHYSLFMQGAAKQLGIKTCTSEHISVHYHANNGFISHFCLSNGETLHADLVIDNSGQTSTFNSPYKASYYVDCTNYFTFDRKLTAEIHNKVPAKPFQQFIATTAGLIEVNTFANRQQITLHYSSQTHSEQAVKTLLENKFADLVKCKCESVEFGYTNKTFNNNCFAIGRAAGYLGTSPINPLILMQRSLCKLLELFPNKACLALNRDELNRRVAKDYQEALHYSLLMFAFKEDTSATQTWQLEKAKLPILLAQKITLFAESGRVASELNPLISRGTWLNLLRYKIPIRQGYDPVLDALDKAKGRLFLKHIQQQVDQACAQFNDYN